EKPGPKVKLGPSQLWPDELKKIRYQRQQIISSPIKITLEGGTPHVPVTLNGRVTQTMVVDSGASAVSISAKTAEQCGLAPGPGDPTVEATLADGRKVKSKLMVLESVQVGPFTVHNVECLVDPAAGDTPALLGATFLRHFSYKSDLAAGELHLTQLTEPTKKDGEKNGEKNGAVLAGNQRSGKKGDGFEVPSTAAWVTTGFNVEAGKCYLVKAKGKWTGANGVATGPQGACPP